MRSQVNSSVTLCLVLCSAVARAGEVPSKAVSLTSPEDRELVVETFLAPGEFPDRVIVHISEGDEAAFSLDSSLSATEPSAALHPERLTWPAVAGLKLEVENPSLTVVPSSASVNDDVLDRGFVVRWALVPLGQRFEPTPHFACRVVGAEVLSTNREERLLYWSAPPPPPVCRAPEKKGLPNCHLDEVGHEVQAVALSPEGTRMAMAFGGLRPRVEMWNVQRSPRLIWQTLFAKGSGGAVETAFSEDGQWVVALTGTGRMHRFDAATGGRHMAVSSSGRTARSIPPGEIMAVAGESGEVTLWYLADGTIAWRLPPRKGRGPVDRIAASGDGLRFATLEYADEQTVARIWAVRQRSLLSEVQVEGDTVVDIALDEKGENLFLSHETHGLMVAKVERKAVASPAGKAAARCKGRLQWMPGTEMLSCATPAGELRVDRQGNLQRELSTNGTVADWIITASTSDKRLAAVGGGRLLIWWTQ